MATPVLTPFTAFVAICLPADKTLLTLLLIPLATFRANSPPLVKNLPTVPPIASIHADIRFKNALLTAGALLRIPLATPFTKLTAKSIPACITLPILDEIVSINLTKISIPTDAIFSMLLFNPSNNVIIIVIPKSTICGNNSAIVVHSVDINFIATSAILGMDFDTAVRKPSISLVPASIILGTPLANSVKNDVIALAKFVASEGSKPIRALSPSTNTNTPAPPVAATVANAAANTPNPNPAAAQLKPILTITPAKVNNTGVTGANAKPAKPKTVKTPAKPNRPIPICGRLNLLSAVNCGINNANAADITNIADAPAKPPVIPAMANPRIVNEPAIVVKLLPISSHDNPPMDLSELDNIVNAILIPPIPAEIVKSFPPGINIAAAAITESEPAIANNPLPISSILNCPNFPIATDIIVREVAMPISPIDAVSILLPLISFVNADNVNITALRAPIPVANLDISIELSLSTVRDSEYSAPDNTNKPVADLVPMPLKFVNVKNSDNSANIAAIPPNPFIIEFVSILPKDLTASAIPLKAIDNTVKPADVFIKPFVDPDNNFVLPTNKIIRDAIPPIPVANSSGFKSDKLLSDADNIVIDDDNSNSVVPILARLNKPAILLPAIIFINAPRPNIISINNTVNPLRAVSICSGFIADNILTDSANIPIADAIFNRVPACKSF